MKIESLPAERFWPIFDKLVPVIFKDAPFYSAREICTATEKKAFSRLKAGISSRLELHLGLIDKKGAVVGWCSSHQTRPYELYMMNSVIFPKLRRKGYYTALVKRTLSEARKLGFQVVTSHHVANNNAVIIAKLKLGFRITGMEIADENGVLVKMSYFLNETRAEVMDFRVGAVRPSRKVKKLLKL